MKYELNKKETDGLTLRLSGVYKIDTIWKEHEIEHTILKDKKLAKLMIIVEKIYDTYHDVESYEEFKGK